MQTASDITTPSRRLVSLDIYRGMTMLAMMAHTLGLKELSHLPVVGFVYRQLEHADWVGFHFEDFILPSFLFIMGVSLALSNGKRRERGESFPGRLKHAAKRSLSLFLFGFVLSWISAGKMVTGPGVLQLLALSYFLGFIFSDMSVGKRFAVFAGLLFTYWFFVFVTPVYDVGRNSYILYKNLVYLIDETLTNTPSRWGYIYTVITSGAIVVYGSIIGDLYRNRNSDAQFMKVLAVCGAAGVAAGLALHPVMPVIKRMFTSSYTLLTCGLASVTFLALFRLVDVASVRRWGFPFVVVGMNSIFIYLLHNLLHPWFMDTLGVFIDPLQGAVGAWITPIRHVTALVLEWFVCLWLYRRKIFFRL
ncbi:MAG: DUF1624 domain-containing protein [Candidatus Latescibacteria bacterium]|nr:DUF1624 domain-containing protein [Candidatus Latescibacterota bacterium]